MYSKYFIAPLVMFMTQILSSSTDKTPITTTFVPEIGGQIETTTAPTNWTIDFNETFVDESGKELSKPDVLSVDTLRGANILHVVERLLFQRTFENLPQPLPAIINFIIRIPVMLIGLMLGENVELVGLQALHVGDGLLLIGAQGYGYAVKDYALGFIAFGKTVKEWFVNDNLPPSAAHLATEDASFGLFWNELGKAYLRTRLEIEELYGSHF